MKQQQKSPTLIPLGINAGLQNSEVTEFWVTGLLRPFIGEIVEVIIVEGVKEDTVIFVINDGSNDINVDCERITATARVSANAA